MVTIDLVESGERTRLARTALGLTVAEAAAVTGLSESTIRRLERPWPAGGIRMRTLASLADGYYIEMDFLQAQV